MFARSISPSHCTHSWCNIPKWIWVYSLKPTSWRQRKTICNLYASHGSDRCVNRIINWVCVLLYAAQKLVPMCIWCDVMKCWLYNFATVYIDFRSSQLMRHMTDIISNNYYWWMAFSLILICSGRYERYGPGWVWWYNRQRFGRWRYRFKERWFKGNITWQLNRRQITRKQLKAEKVINYKHQQSASYQL